MRRLAPFALGAIAAVSLGLSFGALEADPAAWLNGVAAVIVAVAHLRDGGKIRALESRVAAQEIGKQDK